MRKETADIKNENNNIELSGTSYNETKIDQNIIALKQKMRRNLFSKTHIGERVIFALCDYVETDFKSIDDEEIKKDRITRLSSLFNLIVQTKVVGETDPDALLIKKLEEYYNQYYPGKIFGTSLFSSLKRRLDEIYEDILNHYLTPNLVYTGTSEILSLIKENDELQKELSSMSENIKGLTTTIENQENALHTLQEKNNTLTVNFEELEKNHKLEHQKIDELNKIFIHNKDFSEKEIAKLTDERNSLNNRIDKLEIIIKDSAKKNNNLLQQCETQKQRLEKNELESEILVDSLKNELLAVRENMENFVKNEMQKFISLQTQQNQVNRSPEKTSIPFFRNFGGFGK